MILEKPTRIASLLVVVAVSVHTVATTHISGFFELLPAAFWGYLGVAFFMWSDYSSARHDPQDEYLYKDLKGGLQFMAVMVPVIVFVIFSFYTSLLDLYVWLKSPMVGKYQTILITGILATTFAYALFFFRLRSRTLYGVTETFVGLLVAEHHALSISNTATNDPSVFLAILTAGIYLMVRGLDNIHQGRLHGSTLVSQLKEDMSGRSSDGKM